MNANSLNLGACEFAAGLEGSASTSLPDSASTVTGLALVEKRDGRLEAGLPLLSSTCSSPSSSSLRKSIFFDFFDSLGGKIVILGGEGSELEMLTKDVPDVLNACDCFFVIFPRPEVMEGGRPPRREVASNPF